MPRFKVLRRVDAWIDYVAEIEAETAEAAARAAHLDDGELHWQRVGEEEFWNARFVALDKAGEEISETAYIRG